MAQPDPVTPAGEPASPLKPRRPLDKAVHRFLSNPSSGRNAVIVIITAQLVTVVVGGLVIWLVDRKEFAHLTEAFWYTLQTVTTVGYGDVTPVEPIGRFVGAVVMLLGLAALTILTASITSSFIEARQVERGARQDADDEARWARLEARLDEVMQHLDRLERNEQRERDRTDV